MADIAEALYSRLSGDSTLTSKLNGGIHGDTPEVTPKRPYVTYQLINLTERPHAMGSDPDLVVDRYQVDVYADTRADRADVANTVKGLLSRWRGTEAGVEVNATYQVDRRDLYEPDTKLFRRSIDYEIAWYE